MNRAQSEQSDAAPAHLTKPQRRGARRRGPSNALHRALLWVVLAVGAAALTYNAVSIVSGEGGLARLSGAFHAHPPPITIAASNWDNRGH